MSLPTDPSQIKNIVHFTDDETSLNYKYEENAYLIDEDVSICSFDYDIKPFLENYQIISSFQGINKNDTLVKHPFRPNSFIPLDQVEEILFKEMWGCIHNIARYLGAKKCEAELKINKEEKRTLSAKGDVSYKSLFFFNFNTSNDFEEKIKKRYNLVSHFTANHQFSLNDYNQAVELVKQYNLQNNVDIMRLLDQRNPEMGNLLTSEQVSISVTRDVNQILDSAIKLKALSGKVFNLDAKFNTIVESKKDIDLISKIEF